MRSALGLIYKNGPTLHVCERYRYWRVWPGRQIFFSSVHESSSIFEHVVYFGPAESSRAWFVLCQSGLDKWIKKAPLADGVTGLDNYTCCSLGILVGWPACRSLGTGINNLRLSRTTGARPNQKTPKWIRRVPDQIKEHNICTADSWGSQISCLCIVIGFCNFAQRARLLTTWSLLIDINSFGAFVFATHTARYKINV